MLALVGAVNIPIIQKSVEWWNTLHQPATFKITGKASMNAEMRLPLLIMVQLDQYNYAGATAIGVLMLVVSFILLLLINLLQRRISRT